jgi:chemotaxis signal transduction protein
VETHPVILFVVGECTFAIRASGVAEIQSLQEMKPLEGVQFGKVHHTITREGHRYWVVDLNIHFGMPESPSSRVMMLSDSPIALKVDAIVRMTDMTKLLPLPQSFRGDERNWYVGLTVMHGAVIPVVNPASFLTHFDMNALESAAPAHASAAETAGAMA